MTIRHSNYKGAAAITLENDALKVVVIPSRGSKIASIYHKEKAVEILEQNPSETFQYSTYGDCFETGECAGFDDMFPTIAAFKSKQYPWDGTAIPDHGEVWSIPWDSKLLDNEIFLQTHGIRLPYRLEKTMTLEDSSIKIEYSVRNLSPFDFDYIWSAHPLFSASEGMQIEVPGEDLKIMNAAQGSLLGIDKKTYDYPHAKLSDGSIRDLSTLLGSDENTFLKYYFKHAMTEGWCALLDPVRGLRTTISFPVEKIPYMGVWINEGGLNDQFVVALEPSTGAMDSPVRAQEHGMASTLKPHAVNSWHLTISVASV